MDIEIGSTEWKELRRSKITATDAASILGIGFLTPYQLWLRKITGEEEKDNPAMERGRRLEEEARAIFQEKMIYEVKPMVVLHPKHPWLMATLDGVNLEHSVLLEIKCPGNKNHEIAAWDGEVPPMYYAQMQHQMMVTGIKKGVYMSYHPGHVKPVVYLDVHEDTKFIEEMFEKEQAFYEHMKAMTPPPLCQKDTIEIFDPEYLEAAQDWIEARAMVKTWEAKETEARRILERYAEKSNVIGTVVGGNVKVTTILRSGGVDYRRIPQLEGVDLDAYRKNPSRVYMVSVS